MRFLVCRDCGIPITNKRHNAFYCNECAAKRKKQADHEHWVRKRQKRAYKKSRELISDPIRKAEIALQKVHAAELGLSTAYYLVWKEENPQAYRRWMDAHCGATESKTAL